MKLSMLLPVALAALFAQDVIGVIPGRINREEVVRRFNPKRTESSQTTPMQVGNGDFAFGADITGLQSILPYGILSSWGWHNVSLPTVPGETKIEDFTGLDWETHGRLVNYNMPNPAQPNISQWLISNPHRLNLGRIGFLYKGLELTEQDLFAKSQILDLYSGTIVSTFTLRGQEVKVLTTVDPYFDVVAVEVHSQLFRDRSLSIFFDFPYGDGANKFEAPFVGDWNVEDKHKTTLLRDKWKNTATIRHDLDETTYFTEVNWEGVKAYIRRQDPSCHRYILTPGECDAFKFTAAFFLLQRPDPKPVCEVRQSAAKWWKMYFESGAFVDLTSVEDPRAIEVQRRVILSQYLLATGGAGKDPPQESGLTNNGWYGKFHLEMYLWNSLHFARWNKFWLLDRSTDMYERFLDSSIIRAKDQGYEGARWGKMSDPSGRSAPGEINSLLIWQQPHPCYFAELDYRAHPSNATLKKWDKILTATADFMTSYVFYNDSTGHYDLGPPLYPSSENTNPNITVNPTFELAYWRFGLRVALEWKARQNLTVPDNWLAVAENLAPLPVTNELYDVYEGIEDMWKRNSTTVTDHPSLTGIYGLLPAPAGFNKTIMRSTFEMVMERWEWESCWGWDFPMLAMNALKLGEREKAVDLLLHENFKFDEVGMPVGGERVPTPYFPASGALLISVALMAGGWDGDKGGKWPEGWREAVRAEGFDPSV
ncbi:hypothetical protein AJ79_01109 [Helicocarpus griseus UAMH5409]|uniref:Uncharacterized protein n=1 Tax=Helicocarpus griseus UAMH5409 TaxID=1447875 RepID=A0A2B7Y8T5_9EURO|nr:hypothetical protein AJ79_01109 [Helicocarpus griseus UAMH5409]